MRFLVAGLVDEDHLSDDTHQISPRFFLWALLAAGLGVLLLPTAKVWWSGPNTRFGRADIAVLAVSSALTMFSATALFLGFVARERLLYRLERRQQGVATELEGALTPRIEHTVELLDAALANGLDDAGTSEPGTTLSPCTASLAHEIAKRARNSSVNDCNSRYARLRPSAEGSTVPWQRLFWAEKSGKQRIKYVSGKSSTPFVNLKDRPYFVQAMHEQCLGISRTAQPWGCGEGRAVPYVVPSITTAQRVMMLARPTYGDSGHPNGVLVLESTNSDLTNLVHIPMGFQIAVVDASGHVMMHSDNENRQGFNLLDDLEDAAELKATLATRKSRVLDVEYAGEPSAVYVHPLHMGWYILVIAPSSTHDIATKHIVLLVACAFLGFFSCFVVALGIGWLYGRMLGQMGYECSEPLQGLWPNCTRLHAYGDSVRWTLQLAVPVWLVSTMLTIFFPSLFLLFFTATMASSFWILYLAVSSGKTRTLTTWEKRVPFAYTNCCFALMTVLVIAPTSLFFVAACDQVVEGLVRTEQDHTMRVGLSPDHVATAARRKTKLLILKSARAQAAENGDIDPAPITGRVAAGPPTKTHEQSHAVQGPVRPWSCYTAHLSKPFALLLDILPLLAPANATEAALLYEVGRPCGGDTSGPRWGWTWHRVGRRLTVHQGSESLQTDLPSLLSTDYHWPRLCLWFACFAIFILIACVVSYRTLRRLFFLDSLTEEASTTPPSESEFQIAWSLCTTEEQRLLAQIAYDGHASPHPQNEKNLLKLTSLPRAAGATGLVRRETLTLAPEVTAWVKGRMGRNELRFAQGSGEASSWTYLRGPLAAAVGILLITLGASQTSVAAIGLSVPPFLTLLPSILRALAGQSSK